MENPRNHSNGHQNKSLLIYSEVSKLVIESTVEVVKCCLYGGKEVQLCRRFNRVIGQPRKRLGLPKDRETYQVNQKAQITRHTCRK